MGLFKKCRQMQTSSSLLEEARLRSWLTGTFGGFQKDSLGAKAE